jgi:hypothetical protein
MHRAEQTNLATWTCPDLVEQVLAGFGRTKAAAKAQAPEASTWEALRAAPFRTTSVNPAKTERSGRVAKKRLGRLVQDLLEPSGRDARRRAARTLTDIR